MSRLWVRLTLAFGVVILVTVVVVAILANLRAGEAFRLYLAYSGSAGQDPLVERLAAYYEANGSWLGVEALLDRVAIMPGHMRGMRGGFTFPPGTQPQLVLADAHRRVVYEQPGTLSDRRLSRDEEAAAWDITVGGEVVGHLVVALPMRQAILGPLEERFFDRLQQFLLVGGLLAGVLGALLGVAFSRSLTAPLQRLATAARAMASRDFTQRVQVDGGAEVAEVAQAFNEMAAALAEAEQLRKNLMADVAHELRTPLSVLQGNLQAILDDVYELDKTEIANLHNQTRLLSRLVDDLRELALADAGQLNMSLQPCDVGKVLRAAYDSLAPAAETQGIALSVETADDLPLVYADPDRVAQVLHNLLDNALRHTAASGSVTLSASVAGEAVEITVADTGEGIAPTELPHVFDRFWRADRSRSQGGRWAGGSGLGLFIAQSLVKAQGGRIWAESEQGRGATFHFTLPRHDPGLEGPAES
jgi:two-component system OmpR family sensor kinase/two-component system sensor histidine kinase BaeS